MRFLGYGIGHKDQTKDTNRGPKVHNMSRETHRQPKGIPPRDAPVRNAEAMADSQSDKGNETDSSQDDSDADSEAGLDDEDDLDGYF